MILPQLEVKVVEPHRNSSTATSIKRNQTLILETTGLFVHFTLTSGVKVSLGNGYEGVNKHGVGLSPTCK